jgi:hypothetical protein
MGLEVADAPDAGPDDIPSPQHTDGRGILVLAGTALPFRLSAGGTRSQGLDPLGCVVAEQAITLVKYVLQAIPLRLGGELGNAGGAIALMASQPLRPRLRARWTV